MNSLASHVRIVHNKAEQSMNSFETGTRGRRETHYLRINQHGSTDRRTCAGRASGRQIQCSSMAM